MDNPSLPPPRLHTPVRIFCTLLIVISLSETALMYLLPRVLPGATRRLTSVMDSIALTLMCAPVIWHLVVRPLRLFASEEITRTKVALDYLVEAVIHFDGDGIIESLNPAAERMFGYDPPELIGSHICQIIPALEARTAGPPLPEPGSVVRVGQDTLGTHRDGRHFPVEVSLSRVRKRRETGYVVVVHDITERRKYEEQLAYLADHDGLTGLPNRNLLADRLNQALLVARRTHQAAAILIIDLDHFKLVNDTLGLNVGDALLQTVAGRLLDSVRDGDTVARLGGNEFAVIIPDLREAEDAARIAGALMNAVNRPMQVEGHDLVVTSSIGISISPKDGQDVQTLLKNAEVALYRAKEQGRNLCQFCTDELNTRLLDRASLEKNLRQGWERGELTLHYQPKVHLNSGRVTGMEALLRWQSPELGMVPPAKFIPLAEESGLIVPIGEWVLRTACAQNRAWQKADLPPLTVAVNLSPRQFRNGDIPLVVRRIVEETGLDPRHLELEITESLVMENVERVSVILDRLKEIGVVLSMDDFGTGYSCLSYLKRFPFDRLKIDQSFVREITSDPNSAAIVKAVLAMAHSLNLTVVAEGVETESQLNYLSAHYCDEIQGYFFSKPLPAPEFEKLLREKKQLVSDRGLSPPLEDSILVVDDDHEVASSLKRMLTLEGYRVLAASSAEEGFELLANNRVAVVLSDQWMPGMNGSEFLSRVRKLYPDTVRIILSGQADLTMLTDAINRGAIYKFFSKPWDDRVILEKINEAFRHYHAYALQKAG